MFILLRANLRMIAELNALASNGYEIDDAEVQNSRFYQQAQYMREIDASKIGKLLSPNAIFLAMKIAAASPKLEILSLAKNNLGKYMPKIAAIISTSKSIHKLDLQDNNLGKSAIEVVAHLSKMKLSSLNLCFNYLGEHSSSILDEMKNGVRPLDFNIGGYMYWSRSVLGRVFKDLSTLDLSYNSLGKDTIPMAMLIGGENLTVLNISYNNLDEHIMQIDSPSSDEIDIRVDGELTHGKLFRSSISKALRVEESKVGEIYPTPPGLSPSILEKPVPFALRELAKMKLHTLNLCGNYIGEQMIEVVKIIASLEGLKNIVDLNLNFNDGLGIHALEVVKVLAGMNLTALDLSGIDIEDCTLEVTKVVAGMKLKFFGLGYDYSSDVTNPTGRCEQMIEVTNILSTSSTLCKLSLRHNNCLEKFPPAVGDSLSKMKLTMLNICGNFSGTDGAAEAIKKLAQISSLETLCLNDDNLNLASINFDESLGKMSNLRSLSLSHNNFGNESLQLVKRLTQMKLLDLAFKGNGLTFENTLGVVNALIESNVHKLELNGRSISFKQQKTIYDIVETHNDHIFGTCKIICEIEVLHGFSVCTKDIRGIIEGYIYDPFIFTFEDHF